jgi:hypothetical protein
MPNEFFKGIIIFPNYRNNNLDRNSIIIKTFKSFSEMNNEYELNH